jgi:hypothetical protein
MVACCRSAGRRNMFLLSWKPIIPGSLAAMRSSIRCDVNTCSVAKRSANSQLNIVPYCHRSFSVTTILVERPRSPGTTNRLRVARWTTWTSAVEMGSPICITRRLRSGRLGVSHHSSPLLVHRHHDSMTESEAVCLNRNLGGASAIRLSTIAGRRPYAWPQTKR